MNTTNNNLTLEAVSTFLCKKEDGSFYSPSKIITKGTIITLSVPSVITGTTIFTQPDNSKYLDDIISQFHKKNLMISKEQLASGNWKIIE